MELSNITNAVSIANATQAAATASLLLLRKSLDIQAASAIGLIQAIPQATPPSNPANLGNAVDVTV